MKKLVNLSFIYLILGLCGGVFYREFTKYMGYTGRTTLGFVHTHLLVLGTFLFLILALFSLHTNLEELKEFKKFLVIHNIGLPFVVIMMLVRGVLQVLGTELSKGANAAISGMAGIGHIIITVGLVMLFMALKKVGLKAK